MVHYIIDVNIFNNSYSMLKYTIIYYFKNGSYFVHRDIHLLPYYK